MSEVSRVPKYVAAIVATAIGSSALTGCATHSIDTWEVGVTCPNDSEVQIGSLDTDPNLYSDNDARIDVLCMDTSGKKRSVSGMELTKGPGSIINSNKKYSSKIVIKYRDQVDGYKPEISMSAPSGYILTDNVKIESAAVTD